MARVEGRSMYLHAVMDGHGGDACADYVARQLATTVRTTASVDCLDPTLTTPSVGEENGDRALRSIRSLLVQTYRRLDHAYFVSHPNDWRTGCCCLTVLVDPSADVCYDRRSA